MATTGALWRSYDQAALDVQYNSRATVPDSTDFTAFIRQYAERTRACKASLRCMENLRYGSASEERLDIYPAAQPGAPVMVFLHGGDWRSLSKEEAGFAAAAFVAAGVTLVVPDFALVPHTTLPAMGAQVGRMLAWVAEHIGAYGGDASRIHVAGHSSGANLVGQLLTADPIPHPIEGAVFISGLADLEPVRLSFRNQNLHLDRATVLQASLAHRVPTASCPLIVAVGALETDDYRQQARDTARYWTSHGNPAELHELAGRHHFNSVLEWADADSSLFHATLCMMSVD
jgi:arylformamidase